MRLVAGASTQSRARRPLPDGWKPVLIGRDGCSESWRVREGGNKFNHRIEVSWVMDQGGPILGYTGTQGDLPRALLERAQTFSNGLYGPGGVVSESEMRAAEMLCETVGPFILGGQHQQRVRWLANGSDACDCAVRLARAWTSQSDILSSGYHGSSAMFSRPPQNGGILDDQTRHIHDVPFGDSAELERSFRFWDVAAFIVEVPPVDDDTQSFLAHARMLCDRHGALLILDEIVTGFRLALGGAAELYHIKPDIACYGKAMSNGRGISAIVGREEILSQLADRVFYSNTYNGDPYNCAHVLGTLQLLTENADDIYGHIWQIGSLLKNGLNSLGIPTVGTEVRLISKEYDEAWRAFCSRMVKRGILMDRPHYPTMAHSEESVMKTLEAAEAVYGSAL